MGELLSDFGLLGRDQQYRVLPGSSLIGRRLRDLDLLQRYRVWIVVLERTERFGVSVRTLPGPETVIRTGDVLAVQGAPADASRLADEKLAKIREEQRYEITTDGRVYRVETGFSGILQLD